MGGGSPGILVHMSRRDFLHLVSGVAASSLLGACASPMPAASRRPSADPAPPPREKIRAICFDLFTLFDPRSVVSVAQTIVGETASELCEAWRLRQFQYAFLRAAGGRYTDFRAVTE